MTEIAIIHWVQKIAMVLLRSLSQKYFRDKKRYIPQIANISKTNKCSLIKTIC